MSDTTEAFARVKIDALLKDADWTAMDAATRAEFEKSCYGELPNNLQV